jgi:hypothetical protein
MSPIPGNTSSAGKKPTAPTIGTATITGNATASVTFTPSTYIGKGTITYTATSNPGGLTGSSSTSPITVGSLVNGTPYTFTVAGVTNYNVSSDASSFSNPVTPFVSYAISPSSTSVNEGTTVTFTITTVNFGSGTLYWTLAGASGTINNSDFSSPSNAVSAGGSVAITGDSGSFAVVLSNDLTTEGTESFFARLRTGSTSGTIVATSSTVTVGDTSLTPPPPVFTPPPPVFTAPVIVPGTPRNLYAIKTPDPNTGGYLGFTPPSTGTFPMTVFWSIILQYAGPIASGSNYFGAPSDLAVTVYTTSNGGGYLIQAYASNSAGSSATVDSGDFVSFTYTPPPPVFTAPPVFTPPPPVFTPPPPVFTPPPPVFTPPPPVFTETPPSFSVFV